MEIFKTIDRFPDYEVSNFGRVRTKQRQIRYVHAVTQQEHFRLTESRFLKVQFNNRTGYKFHQLYLNKKMHNATIHRLVAETFVPRDPGKDIVNHKDGNKHNNTAENLEWCTNEYNHQHATETGLKSKGEEISSSKLSAAIVLAIKRMLQDNVSHGQIAKWFNISRSNVSFIHQGKIWKHIALTGQELVYQPIKELT